MRADDMTNLNTPALATGRLTEAELARKQADLGAWTMLAEPLDAQMDAQTDVDPTDDLADPWWFQWIVWPAAFALAIAASFIWPLWIEP